MNGIFHRQYFSAPPCFRLMMLRIGVSTEDMGSLDMAIGRADIRVSEVKKKNKQECYEKWICGDRAVDPT